MRAADWHAPGLRKGWTVREVVAHSATTPTTRGPPLGGPPAALGHDVVHGLDLTGVRLCAQDTDWP
ncbi:hypothetical protein [Streptomyces vinaceus]|uniref:hypothetical protein n=1 Tax=Streptomyces vinaceus TaxID=1960 RepID=UPI001E5AD40D|nr:hypothetical protein [Streptomyces vinaceus]